MKVIVAAALAIVSAFAQAQDWPRKPITLVVPNLIGGAYDAAARPLADRLSQILGQPFVVHANPPTVPLNHLGERKSLEHTIYYSRRSSVISDSRLQFKLVGSFKLLDGFTGAFSIFSERHGTHACCREYSQEQSQQRVPDGEQSNAH